ncbi:MAG TPA: EAL domain-containing protein [Asanoa sp.]|jgi:EAL domain-containing protein (putative c-di-GMP-specific phosphodiesterase class I)|nr:EAL domain-containing protein [Asanoa sp.]
MKRAAASLESILARRAVRSVYQPIFELARHDVVGYEALARGPAGTVWENPQKLLDEALRAGRLAELDWVCRAAAFQGAVDAGLPPELSLFVNVEPTSSRVSCPSDLRPLVDGAGERLQVVVEVTERSVTNDPAGLLSALDRWRADQTPVALDDVGAEAESQAMMPLLRPDIIKLDRTITQDPTTAHGRRVVDAARAEAERTGAVLLAEGIETFEHLAAVRAAGATLGQGWLLGRPAPLPATLRTPTTSLPRARPVRPAPPGTTPFEVAAAARRPERVSREVMVRHSRALEDWGVTATEPTVLLTCFQEARKFGPATRRRYKALAAEGIFTAAFGRHMPPDPAPRVRGCDIRDGDPLAGEWAVIVVGSRFVGGLFGRQHDADSFDMVVTDDRDLVLAAATTLARRLGPARA